MSDQRERFAGRDLAEALAAARKRFDRTRREIGFEIIEQPKIGPLERVDRDQVLIDAWPLDPADIPPPRPPEEPAPRYGRSSRGDRETRGERHGRPGREEEPSGPVTLPNLLPGPEVTEPAEVLKHLVESLIAGVDLELNVSRVEQNEIGLRVAVDGADAHLLTDEGEEGLDALQYLVNRILHKHRREVGRVSLDAGGHRAEIEAALLDQARRLADEVRASGEARSMPPLTPFERRLVHVELAKQGDLKTYSSGHGYKRQLNISPAETAE